MDTRPARTGRCNTCGTHGLVYARDLPGPSFSPSWGMRAREGQGGGAVVVLTPPAIPFPRPVPQAAGAKKGMCDAQASKDRQGRGRGGAPWGDDTVPEPSLRAEGATKTPWYSEDAITKMFEGAASCVAWGRWLQSCGGAGVRATGIRSLLFWNFFLEFFSKKNSKNSKKNSKNPPSPACQMADGRSVGAGGSAIFFFKNAP